MWKFFFAFAGLRSRTPSRTWLLPTRLGHLLSVNEIIMPTFASHHSPNNFPIYTYIYICIVIYMYIKVLRGHASSHFSFIVASRSVSFWSPLCYLPQLSYSFSFSLFFYNSINCPLKTATSTLRTTMRSTLCWSCAWEQATILFLTRSLEAS